MFRLFYFESKILLRHVAEADDDDGRQNLGDSRIDMELFDKKFDEDDVEGDADHYQYEIAEKLDPAMQGASGKGDIPVQNKAGGEAYAKGDKD